MEVRRTIAFAASNVRSLCSHGSSPEYCIILSSPFGLSLEPSFSESDANTCAIYQWFLYTDDGISRNITLIAFVFALSVVWSFFVGFWKLGVGRWTLEETY